MLRYHWSIPTTRFLSSVPIALVVVAVSHTGIRRYSSILYHCNGGWRAAISVFLQLCLAAAVIEFLMWISWCVFTRPKLPAERSGAIELKRSLVEGQKLFGPSSPQWRMVLASILAVFSLTIVGIPDACPELDIPKFSLRLFLGGLLFMYSVMMGLLR